MSFFAAVESSTAERHEKIKNCTVPTACTRRGAVPRGTHAASTPDVSGDTGMARARALVHCHVSPVLAVALVHVARTRHLCHRHCRHRHACSPSSRERPEPAAPALVTIGSEWRCEHSWRRQPQRDNALAAAASALPRTTAHRPPKRAPTTCLREGRARDRAAGRSG